MTNLDNECLTNLNSPKLEESSGLYWLRSTKHLEDDPYNYPSSLTSMILLTGALILASPIIIAELIGKSKTRCATPP